MDLDETCPDQCREGVGGWGQGASHCLLTLRGSPSGPWVFLIQASAVGVGAQGWAWGPHGETVTPLGEEATPSSGNSQASWEGSDGSQRAGGPALVNKLLDMEGAALNPPSPP